MKVQGHIFLADLILKDLQSGTGSLNISNAGTFQIPDVIKDAIIKNPRAFRAGAVGPDVHPDIYFGQGIIHTRVNFNSGLWLMIMFEELKTAKLNGLDKNADVSKNPGADALSYDGQAALAYTLGFMTHYATDMFTHTYVNKYAKGAFPNLDFNMDIEQFLIIIRHLVLETYIDNKIINIYKQGENIAIETPSKFLINCFAKYAKTHAETVKKNLKLTNEYDKYILPTDSEFSSLSPLTWLLELRSHLREIVDALKPYSASGSSLLGLEYLGKTNWAGHCENWMYNVDKAMEEWINTSDKIAKALLDPTDKTMNSIQNAAKQWFDNHFLKVMGVPGWLVNLIGIAKDALKPLLALIQPLIDKAKEAVQKFIFDIIKRFINGCFGVDIDQILKIVKAPATYMNLEVEIKHKDKTYKVTLFDDGANTSKKVDADLGNFGTQLNTTSQTFKPFLDSLNLAKLCLIGTANLNSSVFNKVTPEKQREKRLKAVYATIILEENLDSISPAAFKEDLLKADNLKALKAADKTVSLKISKEIVAAAGKIDLKNIAKEQAKADCNFTFGVALKDGREIFDAYISYKLNTNINGKEALTAKIIMPEDVIASNIKQFILKRSSSSAAKVLSIKVFGEGIPNLEYAISDNYTNNKLYFPALALNLKDETETVKLVSYTKEFVNNVALHASDKLYAVIKTSKGWGAGTDDDVFFGVILKDGKEHRVLCDKVGYNDFEKGDLDGYILELPRKVLPSEVKSFFLEKENAPGVGGDWDVDFVAIWLGHYSFGRFDLKLKDVKNKRYYIAENLKHGDPRTPLMLDPKIVSYIKSLDESYQWADAQFLTHPNCQKIFGIGEIDQTVQSAPAVDSYFLKEYILRKRVPKTSTITNWMERFDSYDDNNELLIHNADCTDCTKGELVANLGIFTKPSDARDDALKRGFIDVGLCKSLNGTGSDPLALVRDIVTGKIFIKEWEDLVNPVINSIKEHSISVNNHIKTTKLKFEEINVKLNTAAANFKKETVQINAAINTAKAEAAATLNQANLNTAIIQEKVNTKLTKK